MKEREYLFDNWVPNSNLLIISLILFSITIYRTKDMLNVALIGLTLISYGWSIAFGNWKYDRKRELRRGVR